MKGISLKELCNHFMEDFEDKLTAGSRVSSEHVDDLQTEGEWNAWMSAGRWCAVME